MRDQASISRATSKPRSRAAVPAASRDFRSGSRNDDAGNFVVEAQRLLVAIERPDADEHGNGRFAAEFFDEGEPVLGIEQWLSHGEVRAGFDFGAEALDLVIEIVGDGIDGDADGEIGCAAESFAGPVGALIQSVRTLTRPTESTS